jgi:hypothetical protein
LHSHQAPCTASRRGARHSASDGVTRCCLNEALSIRRDIDGFDGLLTTLTPIHDNVKWQEFKLPHVQLI